MGINSSKSHLTGGKKSNNSNSSNSNNNNNNSNSDDEELDSSSDEPNYSSTSNNSHSNSRNSINAQQLQVIHTDIDYKSLLKKKNHELVNILVEKGPPVFLEFLLYLKSQLAHNSITIRQFLEKVNIVFYLSIDFKDVKTYLASISKPRACHKVWGPNALFYRCKTCALSPSSSICYDCFAAGPHEKEGHDYSTSFAFYGGSCDCGTTDSWKESGFCSNHKHTGPVEDPTINMKSDLLISTHLAIRCILSTILELNTRSTFESEFSGISDTVAEHYSIELLSWIDGVARIGASVSHVLCEELCYQTLDPATLSTTDDVPLKFSRPDDVINSPLPAEFQPPLNILIMLESGEIHSKIVYLFLFLLCDHAFKVGFSKSYTRVYPYLAKLSTIDAVYRYSPQVFSISSISLQFSKFYTPSFLDTTMDTLLAILSASTSVNRHHTAVISDIKTLIQSPSICMYILFEKRSILKKYLQILRRSHCFEEFTRMKLAHIEYDHEDWIYSFQLASELRDISRELFDSITKETPLDDMLDLINYCSIFIMDMVDTEFSGSYLGVAVSNSDLFEGTSSISLVFPLFRFYVQLIQKTIEIYGSSIVDFKTLFPQSINLYRILMPFVLCQVFTHQANNSYWVRNNSDVVRRKTFLYCLFFLENDLSIMQTIASVVNIEEFIIFVSKEFGAFIPVIVRNANDQNNHRYSQFMNFIIQLYQERSSMVSSHDYVKNSLIHLLCGQPKTHSKIESTMMHLDKQQIFEQTLTEIATEQPAHGDHPAIFKMKPEFWKYFNPYYPLYTPQNIEDSIVAYFNYKQSSKKPNPDSLPLPPPLAPLVEWNQQISEIVHSDIIHYIVLSLLNAFSRRAFDTANSATIASDEIPEVMFAVNECLYYLVLSTNQMKPLQGDSLRFDQLNTPEESYVSHRSSVLCILQKFKFKENSISTFDILIELLKRTNQSNAYLEKRDLITKIVDNLYNYHPDIQQLLLEKYPSYMKTLEEQVKSSDDKLKSAKQRQAEIMAKFTQQQNKFLQTIDSDDDLETSDSVSTCVLCLKGHYSKKDPLSVIAMYQYSTLITFSKIPVLANLPPRLKKHCKDFLKFLSFPQQRSQLDLLNYTSSLHMRCCGHHIHHDCFKHYTEALMQKASHHDNFEGDHFIKPLSGEFLCPMCRRVSNIIIPIVDNNNNNNNNNTTKEEDLKNSPSSNLSFSSGSSSSNTSNNNLVNSGKDQLEDLANSGKDQQQPQQISNELNNNNNNNSGSSGNLSLSGKEKMDSFDDVTKNQLAAWFSSLAQKSKSTPPKKSDDHLFFFHELNRVAFKGGNVETISPYFLCQLTARNIEFLEIATREIQQSQHQQTTTTTTTTSNNINNNNDLPQFCIGSDIYSRDILTIKTLYKVFRDYIQQHKENKYRESTIDLFKGMSESILSIDPFGSFILFVSVLDSPSHFDIDVITNFSLDIFVVQFIITKIYSTVEKKKKVSLLILIQEFLDHLSSSSVEEQQLFYQELLLHISPLLRSLCLAQHILFAKIPTLQREDIIVKDKLFSMLNITTLEAIVVKQRKNPLLPVWISRLEKNTPFFIMEPRRPTFIDLPNSYKDIFIKYLSVPCTTCKTIPAKSAICLLCGHLICIDSNCCTINSSTEANKHMNVCGIYKNGVFLETKNPTIAIIRDYRKSLMYNAYLDQYGEPDTQLDRGKPLYRSDFNLQELWCCWISHCLEEKFLKSCTLHGRDY